MSFTLPETMMPLASRTVKEKIVPEKQEKTEAEAERLLTYQKKEFEDIIERQQERIRTMRTTVTIDIECNEGLRRAQLLAEKRGLEEELDVLTGKLDDLHARWKEARQMGNHEFQWGEIKSNLEKTIGRTCDLQAEIQISGKQLEAVKTSTETEKERLNTIRKELQRTQQHVKWMLECQTVDEQNFKNRIRDEEEYLRQLMEARDTTEKEVAQLTAKEGLEMLPLQEDVDVLEMYLEEMQRRTHALQIQCQDLRHQVEETKKSAEVSDQASLSLAYQRAVEYVDQKLIQSLNGKQELARRQRLVPLSVNTNRALWLRNYLDVWNGISHDCKRILKDAKPVTEGDITERKRQIEVAQQRLNEVTGVQGGESREKQGAVMMVENLFYLMRERQKTEAQLQQRLEEAASGIGEPPSSYVSLVKTEGYNDMIDDDDDEPLLPTELNEQLIDPIAEENHEEALDEMRSAVEFTPDNLREVEKLQLAAHRSRDQLRVFLQQKSLLLNEQNARAHVPLRRAVPYVPPNTIEGALSQIQEKLVGEVLSFVKSRKQKIARGHIDPRQETISSDPRYTVEANDIQARARRLLSEYRGTSFSAADRKWSATRPSPVSGVFQRIIVEGARLPPDIMSASPARQAKYFLSCAVRGFTAVMLDPGSATPTVRQLFLTRDLNWLCARDVTKTEVAGLDKVDVTVKLSDVCNIIVTPDQRVTVSKLKPDFSFAIMVNAGRDRSACWVVQTDNSESRRFWAYVLAWIVNEAASNNKDAIIVRLRAANEILVLDAVGATADSVEPTDRHGLLVQVDDK
ncbi:hypothetical protein DQ04_04181020 [Trypanosoma grayi]|uniref:hypothetical protein n=1 Tax=Trypanosoma grayi TaxID=71804 RepID=UPI0004F455F5|nr:hypothetical protein DQ04_04181020 [Trypanosoma grayi]KEG10097.1 hypothetical protein DQ04_04181020 [Trypanosoma grayi]